MQNATSKDSEKSKEKIIVPKGKVSFECGGFFFEKKF